GPSFQVRVILMEIPLRRNWTIVGIPDHAAVSNLGGRVGAAYGPRAFRKALARFKSRLPVMEWLTDAGDAPGLSLEISDNHRNAATLIRNAHRDTTVSVVVGGSHDHGYSH